MHAPLHDLPTQVAWSRRGLMARFTPEIEPYFARYHARELLQRGRIAAMAAALVMLVYMVLDLFMIPDPLLAHFLWVRGLFVITPLLLLWGLSYSAWGERHLQLLGSIVAISTGLAVAALIYIASRNGTPIEYEGIILTLFYFYCCGGLRLKWALPAGLIVGIAYPLMEYHAGLGTREVIVRALFLVTTNIIGAVSAILMEHATRRNFAQTVQLQALAHADPLTGLLNRRALDDRLQTVWRHAMRERLPLYIAMIDIDYFKGYNDHYGHAGGDEVLRQVAQVLQKHWQRPLDLVARYGGEEFVCAWVGGESPAIETMLVGILNEVQTLAIPHDQSPLQRLSLSMGVVRLSPALLLTQRDQTERPLPTSIQTAIIQADTLLYYAKSQGRNCAVWAEPTSLEPSHLAHLTQSLTIHMLQPTTVTQASSQKSAQ